MSFPCYLYIFKTIFLYFLTSYLNCKKIGSRVNFIKHFSKKNVQIDPQLYFQIKQFHVVKLKNVALFVNTREIWSWIFGKSYFHKYSNLDIKWLKHALEPVRQLMFWPFVYDRTLKITLKSSETFHTVLKAILSIMGNDISNVLRWVRFGAFSHAIEKLQENSCICDEIYHALQILKMRKKTSKQARIYLFWVKVYLSQQKEHDT